VLGETALRERLMGKTGLCERGGLWTPPPLPHESLEKRTFLYIKHLDSAWLADAVKSLIFGHLQFSASDQFFSSM
jgi:hypothetical protein